MIREELDGRRVVHAVFRGELFLAELLAIEIGDVVRADNVEFDNLETGPDIGLNVTLREIDQMGLPAIGAAAQLPHDRTPLAVSRRALEIVRKLEEAVQEPVLAVNAVLG